MKRRDFLNAVMVDWPNHKIEWLEDVVKERSKEHLLEIE